MAWGVVIAVVVVGWLLSQKLGDIAWFGVFVFLGLYDLAKRIDQLQKQISMLHNRIDDLERGPQDASEW